MQNVSPAAVFEQGFHGLPDREDVGVLVGLPEAAFDPGEDLHVGEPLLGSPEDDRLLVCHEAEFVQRPPVAAEEAEEALFALAPDPVGADDSFLSHETNN